MAVRHSDEERVNPVVGFAEHASEIVRSGGTLRIQAGDRVLEIGDEVATAVLRALGPVAGTALPELLTTGQAAELLGVSRPTVVKLVDRGVLPAARIGTHRRLRSADVLMHMERMQVHRRAALDEIAALSQDLGLYDS